MTASPDGDLAWKPEWLNVLRRYLAASAAVHFVWEIAQLPLYTMWAEQPLAKLMFAVVHCSAGDVMIAGLSLLAALVVAGRPDWPHAATARVWLVSILIGVGYTFYSEWLNVIIRGNWGYSSLMPTLPVLGTGLAPVLQWFVVPTVAQSLALRRAPWRARALA